MRHLSTSFLVLCGLNPYRRGLYRTLYFADIENINSTTEVDDDDDDDKK